jgi:hypothetical protein
LTLAVDVFEDVEDVDVEVETEDAVEVPLDVPVPVFPLAED